MTELLEPGEILFRDDEFSIKEVEGEPLLTKSNVDKGFLLNESDESKVYRVMYKDGKISIIKVFKYNNMSQYAREFPNIVTVNNAILELEDVTSDIIEEKLEDSGVVLFSKEEQQQYDAYQKQYASVRNELFKLRQNIREIENNEELTEELTQNKQQLEEQIKIKEQEEHDIDTNILPLNYKIIAKSKIIGLILNNRINFESVKREYELSNNLKSDLEEKLGPKKESCPDYIFRYTYYQNENPNVLLSETPVEVFPGNMYQELRSKIFPELKSKIYKELNSEKDPELKSEKYQKLKLKLKYADIIEQMLSGNSDIDPVISQLFPIIHCIHQIGFYHRDIKPQNVVISRESSNYKIHLIDFGHSCKNNELDKSKQGFYIDSTPQYLSPFMIRSEEYFEDLTDKQKKILLIANDYWGIVCTIIYYLFNTPWWSYTKYEKIFNRSGIHYIAQIKYFIENIRETNPTKYLTKKHWFVVQLFTKFFYKDEPVSQESDQTQNLADAEEYIELIRGYADIPRGSTGGGVRKFRKNTKRKKTRSRIKKRKTKKRKTKKRKTKKKKTKKKQRTRRR